MPARNDLDRWQAARLYADGVPLKVMAAKLRKNSPQAVFAILVRAGVKPSRNRRRHHAPLMNNPRPPRA